MPPPLKPYTTLIDFITGRETPNIGAEENRQVVERFLVEQKGYDAAGHRRGCGPGV